MPSCAMRTCVGSAVNLVNGSAASEGSNGFPEPLELPITKNM